MNRIKGFVYDLITFLGSDIKRTNVGYKLLKNVKIDNDVC